MLADIFKVHPERKHPMPTLNWLTREADLQAAAKTEYRLLEEVQKYGDDTDNLIVQGDNLEALKALLPFYAGQMKCIYIDPPYNTGSAFEHYDDNMEHTLWLSMMYPRLELLKRFLREDGLMAIQIDDREFARLYLILIEIFGESNLKTICVKMSEATGLKMASVNKAGTIPKMKEYIILAKKNGVKGLELEKIAKEKWDDEYKIYLDGVSQEDIFRLKDIIANENRTTIDVTEADSICAKFVLTNVEQVLKRELDKTEKNAWQVENAWRIVRTVATTDTAKEIADRKTILVEHNIPAFIIETKQKKAYVIKNGYEQSSAQPRIKLLFADDYLTTNPGDLWTDIKTTGLDSEGGVDFRNGKKPEKLIQRIIKMATNPGDLVLDSFLGSGTTAAVAHKMGRKYIGVEMGEQAKTHCAVRLQKVIDGEAGGISEAVGWKGGGGFRFFKLGSAVFDSERRIKEDISFENLAAHIFFTETKTPMKKPKKESAFLGVRDGIGYALLYNGILRDTNIEGGNVLTHITLHHILTCAEKAGFYFAGDNQNYKKLVIYGEATKLTRSHLRADNIQFKQTPYEIRVW
jgi:adenine-specific DNA-methyltransferase